VDALLGVELYGILWEAETGILRVGIVRLLVVVGGTVESPMARLPAAEESWKLVKHKRKREK
jgi:hypothetical protein